MGGISFASSNIRKATSMKRILLLIILTLAVQVCPGSAHGQIAVEVWVKHYNGLGNACDHPTAVAVDASSKTSAATIAFAPRPCA